MSNSIKNGMLGEDMVVVNFTGKLVMSKDQTVAIFKMLNDQARLNWLVISGEDKTMLQVFDLEWSNIEK